MRHATAFVLFFLSLMVAGQPPVSTRSATIVIKRNETMILGPSDVLAADTIVMEDSSTLRLNGRKNANYIHARVAIIGKDCMIDGRGAHGAAGRNGLPGRTFIGPCKDGGNGRPGLKGDDGQAGVNLFLYLEKIIVNGSLIIDLAGGNGGDGGNGGEGGGGSPGTVHCAGGDGGGGGNAGAGGDGGSGGTVTFGGDDQYTVRLLLGSAVTVYSAGGAFGYGGVPGAGGSAGPGPGKNIGKAGPNGKNAPRGRPGNNGGIQFEQQ